MTKAEKRRAQQARYRERKAWERELADVQRETEAMLADEGGCGPRVTIPQLSTRPQMVRTSAMMHEPVSTTIALTAAFDAFAVFATSAAVTQFAVGAAISVGMSHAAARVSEGGEA